jgi:hypothetical protein
MGRGVGRNGKTRLKVERLSELRREKNMGWVKKGAVPPVTSAAMEENSRFWNRTKDGSHFLAFTRHLEFLF